LSQARLGVLARSRSGRRRGTARNLGDCGITWETLAKNIDEAVDRKIEHTISSRDEDDDWLRVEIASARQLSW
jgi:hypothetical protein